MSKILWRISLLLFWIISTVQYFLGIANSLTNASAYICTVCFFIVLLLEAIDEKLGDMGD